MNQRRSGNEDYRLMFLVSGALLLAPLSFCVDLSGVVRDAAQTPLAGVTIIGGSNRRVTPAEGTFTFANLQAGDRIEFFKEGFQTAELLMGDVSALGIPIALHRLPMVEGRVHSLNSPNGVVALLRVLPAGVTMAQASPSGSNGIYRFVNVQPGTYRLVATGGRGEHGTLGTICTADREPVQLAIGDRERVDLTCSQNPIGRSIRGKLDTSFLSARAGLVVRLVHARAPALTVAATAPSADGVFIFNDIQRGEYAILAESFGGASPVRGFSTVSVQESDVLDVTVESVPLGRLSFRLVGNASDKERGDCFAGFTVQPVLPWSGLEPTVRTFHLRDGEVPSVEGLPVAEYWIENRLPTTESCVIAPAKVVLRTESTLLDLTLLRGSVVTVRQFSQDRATNAARPAAAVLRGEPVSGTFHRIQIWNWDRPLVFRSVPPGRYRFEVHGKDIPPGATESIEVVGGEPVAVAVRLPER